MTAAREVIVVGAGVAGLAAASALARGGAKVTVLERKPYVGGRAYSYLHPALDEVVDSQHVLLGCCTNLIDMVTRAGVADKVRWYETQTFLEPGGRVSKFAESGLPAPLHFLPGFVGAGMLSWGDKISIARGLMEFLRGYPADDSESMETWLRRTAQTERAVRHFWGPVLMATLNDGAANCSTRYAGQVFHELFVKSSSGGRLGIPTVPLSEFYGGVAKYVEGLGGVVKLRASVEKMERVGGVWRLTTTDGEFAASDVVLALPFEQTQRLLVGMRGERGVDALEAKAEKFVHSPFTSILLWFDREISELDHAFLLDRKIEWFFHKSRIRGWGKERGSYVELVIAGSRAELTMGREEVLASALEEFYEFFPAAKEARLVKSGVLKEARATFSVVPGLEKERPWAESGVEGLFVAGDWARTGWPSTMEGGVRSGYLAAEAVAGERFLVPDLAPSGLMRWLL